MKIYQSEQYRLTPSLTVCFIAGGSLIVDHTTADVLLDPLEELFVCTCAVWRGSDQAERRQHCLQTAVSHRCDSLVTTYRQCLRTEANKGIGGRMQPLFIRLSGLVPNMFNTQPIAQKPEGSTLVPLKKNEPKKDIAVGQAQPKRKFETAVKSLITLEVPTFLGVSHLESVGNGVRSVWSCPPPRC